MKKPTGSYFEYENERNQDLMRAYKEQLSQQYCSDKPILLKNVFEKIAEMPSKRFWVSEERATIVVSGIMKGDMLEKAGQMKKEMFFEIYKRVMELMEHKPHLMLPELVTIVCNQPAPKFYLTPKSIKVIISKIKRKWYEERKRKLQHLS